MPKGLIFDLMIDTYLNACERLGHFFLCLLILFRDID